MLEETGRTVAQLLLQALVSRRSMLLVEREGLAVWPIPQPLWALAPLEQDQDLRLCTAQVGVAQVLQTLAQFWVGLPREVPEVDQPRRPWVALVGQPRLVQLAFVQLEPLVGLERLLVGLEQMGSTQAKVVQVVVVVLPVEQVVTADSVNLVGSLSEGSADVSS